ncbi:phosphatase [Serinicoccus sp. CUA-874]|uniref:PHP domain-containing protein n=1 Tax=Serinicoccus sp. CUA-874 TaxID=1517939 RepID=UPI0009689C60|nr:PHP domain-containing protein [Serinicoccus sp. CUA-874]OLT17296.1 phosphatase [Serinicoccus sp. CUA-874]
MPRLSPTARVDLHTHSTHSDGTQTPGDLVREAAATGLDVLGLTDHDAVSGWEEADRAGREHGVVVVPGVEISCSWQGRSVHLLAYLPDPGDEALSAELARTRESRTGRLRRMVRRLESAGYPVTWEEVLAQAGDVRSLGRPHIADVLVRQGSFPDRDAAFADVLHSRSSFHVAHYAPSPTAAIELVRAAGGAPVLAHPFAAARGHTLPQTLLEELAAEGLAGIEVEHRDHTPQDRDRAARLARQLDLLPTGSSDYHGSGKPNRLGEHTTSVEVLRALLEQTAGQLLGASP